MAVKLGYTSLELIHLDALSPLLPNPLGELRKSARPHPPPKALARMCPIPPSRPMRSFVLSREQQVDTLMTTLELYVTRFIVQVHRGNRCTK